MALRTSDIPVAVVSIVERPRGLPAPLRRPWLFAAWMAAASLLALFGGLALGLLAVLEVSIGGERWTPSVQAHGRLQLFGFVATFVAALVFEFLPRMNQRPPFRVAVRVGVPAGIALGALLLAASQVFYEETPYLALPGALLFSVAAIAYTAAVCRVKPSQQLRRDPQPLFLRAAALWLLVAAALTGWAVSTANAGVVALDLSRAVAESFLRGFVMLTIIGVGVRAFVGHLGLRPLSAQRQFVVLVALQASLIAWLGAQGLGSLPRLEPLVQLADAAYAGTVVLLTLWLGLVPRIRRAPGKPRYEWLIPIAWLGLLAYALMLLGAALLEGDDLSLYQEGAIRHMFMLGFMIPLMVAMSHVVLARFGTGSVPWERALTAAFFLLLAAWPLRVFPALTGDAPSDAERALLATAGFLAMAGLALVAAVCARCAFLLTRRRSPSIRARERRTPFAQATRRPP